jgi:hypothetical protein
MPAISISQDRGALLELMRALFQGDAQACRLTIDTQPVLFLHCVAVGYILVDTCNPSGYGALVRFQVQIVYRLDGGL